MARERSWKKRNCSSLWFYCCSWTWCFDRLGALCFAHFLRQGKVLRLLASTRWLSTVFFSTETRTRPKRKAMCRQREWNRPPNCNYRLLARKWRKYYLIAQKEEEKEKLGLLTLLFCSNVKHYCQKNYQRTVNTLSKNWIKELSKNYQ